MQKLKKMECFKGDLEKDVREYFIRILIRGDQEFDSLEDKSTYVSNKRIYKNINIFLYFAVCH